MCDRNSRPEDALFPSPRRIRVRGFICASDPNGCPTVFRSDQLPSRTGAALQGENEHFAPGPAHSLAEIKVRATATATLRRFGSGSSANTTAGHAAPDQLPGPPAPLPSGACRRSTDPSVWRGDAVSSWTWPDIVRRSTITPYHPWSPVRLATDGRSAYIGASSGHVGGVTSAPRWIGDHDPPSINPKVWRDYATIGEVSQGETKPSLNRPRSVAVRFRGQEWSDLRGTPDAYSRSLIFDFGNVVSFFDYLRACERFGHRLGWTARTSWNASRSEASPSC